MEIKFNSDDIVQIISERFKRFGKIKEIKIDYNGVTVEFETLIEAMVHINEK